jgi:hypothetical protein
MQTSHITTVLAVVALLAAAAAPCATLKNGIVPQADVARVSPYLGDYEGHWSSEISRYELELPVLRLALDSDHRLTIEFFMDAAAAARGEPLDLLGFGCNSKVGPLLQLAFTKATGADKQSTQLDASFDFDWGRCPARVYAVPSNDLLLTLTRDTGTREYVATLKLLKSISADDTLYAVADGQRREVKVRPKADGGGSLYHPALEYCVQNDLGETEQCFEQKSELKRFLVPFPFPGLSGAWYTKKSPKFEIVKGRKVEYHEAEFRRAMPAGDH